MIDYKFREDELLVEVKSYIDSTYDQHYGKDKIQTSEVIVARGRGMGFFLGNVDKYSNRYGSKGTSEDHRKDLMKVIHYGLLALYEHDRVEGDKVIEMTTSQRPPPPPPPPKRVIREDVLNFFYGK